MEDTQNSYCTNRRVERITFTCPEEYSSLGGEISTVEFKRENLEGPTHYNRRP